MTGPEVSKAGIGEGRCAGMLLVLGAAHVQVAQMIHKY